MISLISPFWGLVLANFSVFSPVCYPVRLSVLGATYHILCQYFYSLSHIFHVNLQEHLRYSRRHSIVNFRCYKQLLSVFHLSAFFVWSVSFLKKASFWCPPHLSLFTWTGAFQVFVKKLSTTKDYKYVPTIVSYQLCILHLEFSKSI